MDISVITPVYYGNDFLTANVFMMLSNADVIKRSKSDISFEYILVNDSPEVKMEYDESFVKGFEVVEVQNDKNSGIHASRVNGLKRSRGKYVVFLDQDDVVSPDFLIRMFEAAKSDNADVVLCNGYFNAGGRFYKIYGNDFSGKLAANKNAHVWLRDFIVSPGQCMIKKDSIPEYWTQNIMKNNGTDDYLLWLLIFEKGAKMSWRNQLLYTHLDFGSNLSLDDEKMFASTRELLDKLKDCDWFGKKRYKLIERRIYYKHADRSNRVRFAVLSIKNFDIFLANALYRMFWRGYLV